MKFEHILTFLFVWQSLCSFTKKLKVDLATVCSMEMLGNLKNIKPLVLSELYEMLTVVYDKINYNKKGMGFSIDGHI